jgi:ribosomal protein S18 acetylase RimI-like enzyme
MSSSSSDSAPKPARDVTVRLFNPDETHLVPYLAAIHANCITADQAIVSFLPPIDREKLLQFWRDMINQVRTGERLMVVLFDESMSPQPTQLGLQLMGVVMLSTPPSETGPFRGWIEKLLVSPRFRRKGAATALMRKLEEEALRKGRTLLV